MTELVHYRFDDGGATITLDDGKRNALSPEMFQQTNACLDRAEADRAIVIITGREEVFSAGFDLKVMRGAPLNALRMLRAGYTLTARVLAYPYPVIMACNGHALAAEFAELDMPAHTASKQRIRGPLIRYIRRSVPLDVLDAAWVGVKGALRGFVVSLQC